MHCCQKYVFNDVWLNVVVVAQIFMVYRLLLMSRLLPRSSTCSLMGRQESSDFNSAFSAFLVDKEAEGLSAGSGRWKLKNSRRGKTRRAVDICEQGCGC